MIILLRDLTKLHKKGFWTFILFKNEKKLDYNLIIRICHDVDEFLLIDCEVNA